MNAADAVYLQPGDTLYFTVANGKEFALRKLPAEHGADALLFTPLRCVPVDGCQPLCLGDPLHLHGAGADTNDYDTRAPITDIWLVRATEVM